MSQTAALDASAPHGDAELASSTIRAVTRRLVWYLLALYFLAVLDRGALSFAGIQMTKDLGLTAQMFGISVGIMFGAYALFEVPSNLILARFGARITLTRIAMLWGLATILLAFTQGPLTLYLFRGFLGFAESGLYPGIMLLFSMWIPFAYRARYNAILNYAAPVSYIVASLISGAILQLHGTFGLAGWKWLFVLEGIPAILLGIVGIFYLTDKPRDATWLSPKQKQWLEDQIERDVRDRSVVQEKTVWKTLRQPIVLVCGLINFGIFGGLGTLLPWLPQIAKGLGVPTSRIGIVTAIPAVAALVGMAAFSRHSDHRQERFFHTAFTFVLGALGLVVVAFATEPVMMLVGYVIAFVGCFATQAIFWTIPQSYVSRGSAPGAIGLVGMIGSLGGLAIPITVGTIRDWTGGFRDPLLLVAGLMMICAVLVLVVRSRLVGKAAVVSADA